MTGFDKYTQTICPVMLGGFYPYFFKLVILLIISQITRKRILTCNVKIPTPVPRSAGTFSEYVYSDRLPDYLKI